MIGLIYDVSLAWRSLARTPSFTLIAVATLALGIGATTAIFSVIDAVLLRPLPYESPEELVLVWDRMEKSAIERAPVSSPDFVDFRQQARLFKGFAATNNVNEITLTGDGSVEQVKIASVTDNFFDLLGVRPSLGRTFLPEDGQSFPQGSFSQPGGNMPSDVIVLSHQFWQRRFAGDPEVVGQTLWADGRPLEVVGILPSRFRLFMPPDAGMPSGIDAWMPQRVDHSQRPRDQQWLRVIARLDEGVTVAQADAEMKALAASHRQTHAFHRNMGVDIEVRSLQDDMVAHIRPILVALAGAVGFVLLIACVNVASLVLARAASRQRQMAVRVAVGAGRGHLVRQSLAECSVVAVLGAAFGLLFSQLALRWLLALQPQDVPRVENVALNSHVLWFAIGATAVSALIFGLAPAFSAASTDAMNALRERSRASAGALRTHGILVVIEVALAMVLLVGAGLMARSFANLTRIEPGFRAEGAMAFKISLPFQRAGSREDRALFFRQMEEGLMGLPGVQATGSIFPAPLGGRFWTGPYGDENDPAESWVDREANFRSVTPGYFDAIAANLLTGRSIHQRDVDEQRDVAVVDHIFVQRMWPDIGLGDAVGRRFGMDIFGTAKSLEVVGVVEHVRHADLTADGSETIYFPFHLWPWSPMTVMTRTAADPAALGAQAQAVVAKLDREIPIYAVRTLDQAVQEAIAPQRFSLVVIAIFAVVALLLASVGIFGVLSYVVRQRTAEIGVRMALGAAQSSILRSVVGRCLRLVGVGIVLGLGAAMILSRAFASLLFGVRPIDPATYFGLSALLLSVALIASLVPAWRASRVDPMATLRAE